MAHRLCPRCGVRWVQDPETGWCVRCGRETGARQLTVRQWEADRQRRQALKRAGLHRRQMVAQPRREFTVGRETFDIVWDGSHRFVCLADGFSGD